MCVCVCVHERVCVHTCMCMCIHLWDVYIMVATNIHVVHSCNDSHDHEFWKGRGEESKVYTKGQNHTGTHVTTTHTWIRATLCYIWLLLMR